MTSDQGESVRIDLWLKTVCLFKHRSQATRACQGGHVRINGHRARPSSLVRLGDTIEVQEEHLRRFVVVGIPKRQVSKKESYEMYRDESPEIDRELARLERRAGLGERDRGAGRPTKRERREIEKWKK